MESARATHDQAMGLYTQAMMARARRDQTEFHALATRALELEKKAAMQLVLHYEAEPTRSVMFRGAATIAYQLNEFREAEKMIAFGLSGNPPEAIAQELRDLMEQVNFFRHLQLRDLVLKDEEMQLSLASGTEVGFGYARREEFTERVDAIGNLLYRTAERKYKKPFRKRGKVPENIRENLPIYLSAASPGSYSVVLKVGQPSGQLKMEGEGFYNPSEFIDEMLGCMDLLNAGHDEELRSRIPDLEYYRHFVSQARRIAPDGERVTGVGFTVTRGVEEIQHSLQKLQAEIRINGAEPEIEEDESEEGRRVVLEGILDYAAAASNQIKIYELVGEKRKNPQTISVPDGLGEIVRNYFGEVVKAHCLQVSGKRLELVDIFAGE
jgi:hypothetical protein